MMKRITNTLKLLLAVSTALVLGSCANRYSANYRIRPSYIISAEGIKKHSMDSFVLHSELRKKTFQDSVHPIIVQPLGIIVSKGHGGDSSIAKNGKVTRVAVEPFTGERLTVKLTHKNALGLTVFTDTRTLRVPSIDEVKDWPLPE